MVVGGFVLELGIAVYLLFLDFVVFVLVDLLGVCSREVQPFG